MGGILGRETNGKFHKTDEYEPRNYFLGSVLPRKGFPGFKHQTEKNGRRLMTLLFLQSFCKVKWLAETFGGQFAFNAFRLEHVFFQ